MCFLLLPYCRLPWRPRSLVSMHPRILRERRSLVRERSPQATLVVCQFGRYPEEPEAKDSAGRLGESKVGLSCAFYRFFHVE